MWHHDKSASIDLKVDLRSDPLRQTEETLLFVDYPAGKLLQLGHKVSELPLN